MAIPIAWPVTNRSLIFGVNVRVQGFGLSALPIAV
jgi:hypothetical protein